MRPIRLLPLFALLACPATAQAASQPAAPMMEVQAMMQKDGGFGYCLADTAYADGRKLGIALSPRGELNFNMTIPAGGFERGKRYDLVLRLDDQDPRNVRALAVKESDLVLQMGVNEKLRSALAGAHQISLGASGTPSIGFALPAMKPVMARLQQCLDQNAPQAPTPKAPALQAPALQAPTLQVPQPAAPTTPQSKTTKPAPAAKASDFPQPLHQLLLDAGLTGIEPLPMDDIPVAQRPADYIWQTGSILGGVRERALPAGKTLAELVGIHMQGLREKCTGKFQSEINKEQKIGALTLRTALATCPPAKNAKGETITVGLVFYLTQKNVFAVFTHEGPEKAKTEIVQTRDKIARFLLDLARREKNGE